MTKPERRGKRPPPPLVIRSFGFDSSFGLQLDQPFPRLPQGLGYDAHVADDAHEVRVAGPAGDDVLVEVAGEAGAGASAEVDADVEALGADGPLEQADALGRL